MCDQRNKVAFGELLSLLFATHLQPL